MAREKGEVAALPFHLLQAFHAGLDRILDLLLLSQRLHQERLVVIGVLFQLSALHLDGGPKILNGLPLRIDLAPKFGESPFS